MAKITVIAAIHAAVLAGVYTGRTLRGPSRLPRPGI
jgi:hypothetical protein